MTSDRRARATFLVAGLALGSLATWVVSTRAVKSTGVPAGGVPASVFQPDAQTALLAVSPARDSDGVFFDPDFDRLLATHVGLLRSPALLAKAVEDGAVTGSAWGRALKAMPAGLRAAALQPHVTVSRVPSTALLAVRVNVTATADAAALANAVADAYERECQRISGDHTADQLAGLGREVRSLQATYDQEVAPSIRAAEKRLNDLGVALDGRLDASSMWLEQIRAELALRGAAGGGANRRSGVRSPATSSAVGEPAPSRQTIDAILSDVQTATTEFVTYQSLTQREAHLRTRIAEVEQATWAVQREAASIKPSVNVVQRAVP